LSAEGKQRREYTNIVKMFDEPMAEIFRSKSGSDNSCHPKEKSRLAYLM
jgi:hypothetical protein